MDISAAVADSVTVGDVEAAFEDDELKNRLRKFLKPLILEFLTKELELDECPNKEADVKCECSGCVPLHRDPDQSAEVK